MTTSTIKALLPCELERVWAVVLDVEAYSAWRSDLARTETLSEKQFVEYSKEGYPTTFTVTALEPQRRWEFDMENSNMTGHWIGLFRAKGAETEVEFTEQVTAKKLLMKPFVKAYLRKQQAQFIQDLKKALAQ